MIFDSRSHSRSYTQSCQAQDTGPRARSHYYIFHFHVSLLLWSGLPVDIIDNCGYIDIDTQPAQLRRTLALAAPCQHHYRLSLVPRHPGCWLMLALPGLNGELIDFSVSSLASAEVLRWVMAVLPQCRL